MGRQVWVLVAPEAVGSLAPCDLVRLLAMREPPALQGLAQQVGRGIRKCGAQREWRRGPGDRLKRADGVQDVLGRAIKGVGLRVKGPGGAVRREQYTVCAIPMRL